MTGQWPNRSIFGPGAGLILLLAGLFAAPSSGDEWADRSAVIKPRAKELTWLKIPWVLDLKAAQKMARAEARPIFLWVTGDEPLGRC